MGEQKLTLVLFLGGVTQAEVAAFRFLAQQDDGMYVCMLLLRSLYDDQFFLECLCYVQSSTIRY